MLNPDSQKPKKKKSSVQQTSEQFVKADHLDVRVPTADC